MMNEDWKSKLASLAAAGGSGGRHEDASAAEDTTASTTPTSSDPAPRPQNLRVVVDRKGRKGKVATIIEGFTLPDGEVEEIASELKRIIGTGGSARGGEILLQGEWADKAMELLWARGYKVKK